MVNGGYIERCGRGNYKLSAKFHAPGIWGESGYQAIRRTVTELSEELGESIVAGTLNGHKVVIVIQAQAERKLMINQAIVYENLSLYHSVTGRVLLAFSTLEKRRFCFAKCGVPGREWNNAVTFEDYEAACAEVREAGISIMENPSDGIKSFAVLCRCLMKMGGFWRRWR